MFYKLVVTVDKRVILEIPSLLEETAQDLVLSAAIVFPSALGTMNTHPFIETRVEVMP